MTTLPAVEIPASLARTHLLRRQLIIGTCCGLLAAFGYTATNVCLRHVATHDPFWVSFLRSLPTVLIFGPWLLVRRARGESVWPAPHVLGVILLGGCAAQLCGNIAFQWSLRVVGLAMAVPLCLGTLIVGGAVLGRILLKEPITPRVAMSLGILVAAIAVLSLGANDAHETVAKSLHDLAHAHPLRVVAGVLAACLSGVCFACLGVAIRYGVTNHASPTTTMFSVGMIGVVGLGAISLWQPGPAVIAATSGPALVTMLLAGVLNALSFLAMTKALQLTNVAYAYALNATQATMGALAGILFFQEATTPWLGLGVGLTIGGLLYLGAGRRQRREDVHNL